VQRPQDRRPCAPARLARIGIRVDRIGIRAGRRAVGPPVPSAR
jgi:hypothetical protein